MSKENFEIALRFLFPAEGGYVNDKDDRGGPTNMGVTQSTYNTYRKRKGLPLNDVKYLTKSEAINLYYEDYWKLSGADTISDPNMAVALFDTAVLHGPYQAKQYYKKSNGNLNKFLDIRQNSYDKIVENHPEQKKFYQGWNNRVNNLRSNIINNKFTSQIKTENAQNKNIDINKQNSVDFNNNLTQEIQPEYTYNIDTAYKLYVNQNEYLPSYLPSLNDLMVNPIDNKQQLPSNKQSWNNIPYANPISVSEHIFTPEEIGNMTPDEFKQNELIIMEQLQSGQIRNQSFQIDYKTYQNFQNKPIYTREDIENMTLDDYSKNEQEITSQMNSIGIPYKKDLPNNIKTYENEKSYPTSSSNAAGKWVTINGNHVLIKD